MRILITLCIISNPIFSQEREISSYLFKKYYSNDDTLSYRFLKPYRKTKENIPLIIFLHGSGERGKNNKSQLIHGGRFFLKETENKNFNSYVIFPQCKKNSRWSNHQIDPWISSNSYDQKLLSDHSEMLVQLIYSLIDDYNIDSKRIYIMGLSMGGYGTFDLTSKRPEIFAGAVPICGGANMSILNRASSVPHWIFHGELDRVVPVTKSRQAFKLLSKINSHHLYTEYKNVYHNSWENVFSEGDFLDWLFSKSL
tara:strand:+ start:3069 stop:3830 length:762 start_codon:yes stop_codon:yes gene_type:complete